MLNYFGGPEYRHRGGCPVCGVGGYLVQRGRIQPRPGSRRRVRAGARWLMALNGAVHVIDVRWAKGQQLPDEFFVRWNSFSRIAIAPERGNPGVNLIYIDADASTGIPPFDWNNLDERTRHNLLYDGPASHIFFGRPRKRS